MNKNLLNILSVYFFVVLLTLEVQAQKKHTLKTDSLLSKLSTTSDDSTLAQINYYLSIAYQMEDPILGLWHAQKYLEIVTQLQDTFEIVSANNRVGISYYDLGEYDKTISYFEKSLSLLDTEKDAATVATLLNNIGVMYGEMGLVKDQISYSIKALNIRLKLPPNPKRIATSYTNIGSAYLKLKNYDSAYTYISKAHHLDLQVGDSVDIIQSAYTMGEYFLEVNQYDSALYYVKFSNNIAQNIDNQRLQIAKACVLKGKILSKLNKNNQAYSFYMQALNIGESIEATALLKDIYSGLYYTSKNLGNYQEAVSYLESHTAIKDSIFNKESREKLQSVEKTHQLQEKEHEIRLLEKERKIDQLTIANNNQLLFSLLAVVFLLAIIGIFFQRKHKFKVNALKVINRQQEEIVIKNQSITDSIKYAKGIQDAMLPTQDLLKRCYPESFVFISPASTINGDFYWLYKDNNVKILAVIDCTGHGVPGALMTVMANTLLNQIVGHSKTFSPSDILLKLHLQIKNILHSNGNGILNDNGLDGAICCISESSKMTFAGAKRPLYFFKRSNLEVVRGDFRSVGTTNYKNDLQYESHEFSITKGDNIYLFTDGIVDQFGGVDNKKFMEKRLKELLLSINHLDMDRQEIKLKEALNDWKGNNEQIDDMLMVGLKI